MSPRWLARMLAIWVALLGPTLLADPSPLPEPGKKWTLPEFQMVFLPVAAGTYTRGDDQGLRWEKPAHQVRLSKPYWMARTEVTNQQYREFLRHSHYEGSKHADGDHLRHYAGGEGGPASDEAPVIFVSWHNAVAFAAFVTAQEKAAGRLPAGLVYRLPTEAEWEYACRAGTDGENAGPLDELAWYDKNSAGNTKPVASKKPNAWGLFDMHGNVFEWCLDYKDAYPSTAQTDPAGPTTGDRRITRGGGWYSPARHCRSAYRADHPAERTSFDLGFRLVLATDLAPPAPPAPPAVVPPAKP